MARIVGPLEEVRRDGCRIVAVGGRRIGVISVGEAFFALDTTCPHRGANLCHGTVSGTLVASQPQEYAYARHERVIRCPWHGWEFDLDTGRSLLEPARLGIGVYPVTVEDGQVLLHA